MGGGGVLCLCPQFSLHCFHIFQDFKIVTMVRCFGIFDLCSYQRSFFLVGGGEKFYDTVVETEDCCSVVCPCGMSWFFLI